MCDDGDADPALGQATTELAATYAALILADDNVEITVRTASPFLLAFPRKLTLSTHVPSLSALNS